MHEIKAKTNRPEKLKWAEVAKILISEKQLAQTKSAGRLIWSMCAEVDFKEHKLF